MSDSQQPEDSDPWVAVGSVSFEAWQRQHSETETFRPAGFHGDIAAVQVLEQSRPEEIRPLTAERPSPDLSLEEMASWNLNYLIHNPKPHMDYECRFCHDPLGYPPAFDTHDRTASGDTDARMDKCFIFMREMSGRRDGLDVEQALRRRILGYLRDDGLSWTQPNRHLHWDGQPGASTWTTAKTLEGVVETHARTGDRETKALSRRMFEGLRSLAIWDTGRAWYEGGGLQTWRAGQWKKGYWTAYPSQAITAVLRYWEVTGDEEALAFGRAMAYGLMDGLQPNVGHLGFGPDGSFSDHVHLHLHAARGVAYLGALTRDPRAVEWARRVLDFIVGEGSDYGWVPELTHVRSYQLDSTSADLAHRIHYAETCCIADRLDMAVWAARAGYAAYWDDVERTVRNYLRGTQFFVTPAFEDLYRFLRQQRGQSDHAADGLRRLKDLEGGFVNPSPNDLVLDHFRLFSGPHISMVGCCQGEGPRALHQAWQNIVRREADGVYVNMALNRDAPEARVVSFLPEEGRLTVVAKVPGDVYVRPPAWALRNQVRTYRGSQPVDPEWRGDYLRFAGATAGEELTLTYPLLRFRQWVDISHAPYIVDWLGNTVVGITPGPLLLSPFKPWVPDPKLPPAQEFDSWIPGT